MWWLKAYILLRVCYLGDCTPNNWSALWYFAVMLSYVIIVLNKVTSVLVWIKWFRCQLPQLATFYSFLKRTYMIVCPNFFVCPHCSKQSIIVCTELISILYLEFASTKCYVILSLEIGGCTYTILELCPFINGKIVEKSFPFYKFMKFTWSIVKDLAYKLL